MRTHFLYLRRMYLTFPTVEYPRKVTSYLSMYSLFVMTILIYVTCGLEMSKDKEYRELRACQDHLA